MSKPVFLQLVVLCAVAKLSTLALLLLLLLLLLDESAATAMALRADRTIEKHACGFLFM